MRPKKYAREKNNRIIIANKLQWSSLNTFPFIFVVRRMCALRCGLANAKQQQRTKIPFWTWIWMRACTFTTKWIFHADDRRKMRAWANNLRDIDNLEQWIGAWRCATSTYTATVRVHLRVHRKRFKLSTHSWCHPRAPRASQATSSIHDAAMHFCCRFAHVWFYLSHIVASPSFLCLRLCDIFMVHSNIMHAQYLFRICIFPKKHHI